MNVVNLKLKNFRNYQSAEVNFSRGINLISGLNGQGKTNLVEAIVVASRTKSPRTHNDKDMILSGADGAQVNLVVNKNEGDVLIDFYINKTEEKSFVINNNPVSRVGQVFGNLVCVYFSPQELKIVSGAPSDRRDFLDDDISMLSESYYNLCLRYEKVLAQRNKLLKTERDPAKIIDTIGVWDEQLASIAAAIVKTRKSFVNKLSPMANKFLNDLSANKEDLKLSYVGVKGETRDEIKKNLLRALDEGLSRDMELGYTGVGPHRDDLKIELNGADARVFSSQGQSRSIALALKLAEMKIMEEELGEKPVVILDDVFSELDTRRQRKLFEAVEDAQAIFTGTSFKFKPKDTKFVQLKVQNGTVAEVEKVKGKSLNFES